MDAPAQTALIVSLTRPTVPAMRAGMAEAAEAGADMVECRLDYLERTPTADDLRSLLEGRPLPAIATCRPVRQGGRYEGPEGDRLAVLAAAAEAGCDYVDVEDDVPAERRPGGRIVLSHHDFTGRPADLDAVVARLAAADPAVVKIAFAAAGPEDALSALDILRRADRPPVALARGEAGVAGRILARRQGAFGTFAALESGAESAPGQPTVAEFRRRYGWDRIRPTSAVYGVIGCPVGHSMSPAIHNAAFAAAGVDAVYVPLRVEPGPAPFHRFLDAVAEAPWAGLAGCSVTIPHKENALARIGRGRVEELAGRIGAVNTIRVEPDGSLAGWNTDYAASLDALAAGMSIDRSGLAGRTVAVIGAGGAARALVAGLAHCGAAVTIYNRTFARAEALAAEFGAAARPLEQVAGLAADVVVNCTSVGMHPNVTETPVPAEALQSVGVVFDTIYNPVRTRLLREAAAAGCIRVSGVDMFVNQAVAQFEIWTGRPAPRERMREVVLRELGACDDDE
jgi:3-dehydroquinate dehydratase/shikimate dehydrogenase